jgi:hypothetical protein
MSSSPQLQEVARFTDRTPYESICMTCFATVRAAHSESLEACQRRHASECSGWVGSEPDRSGSHLDF